MLFSLRWQQFRIPPPHYKLAALGVVFSLDQVAGFPVLINHNQLIIKLFFTIKLNQVAMGVAGYPILVYHVAECCCHLGLAASVFLTIAITLERYQVL